MTEQKQNAVVFDEWQSATELSVPKSARFFTWKDGNFEGEALGFAEFSNVRFSTDPAVAERFKKPPDAVLAPGE
jgi:hypothetical protein